MKKGDVFKFVKCDGYVAEVTVLEFDKDVGATFYSYGALYFCLHGKLSPVWNWNTFDKDKSINAELLEYIADSVDRHGMILEATWRVIYAKHTGVYVNDNREYTKEECAFT